MKKIAIIIAILGLTAGIGGTVFGIARSKTNDTVFEQNGAVLLGEDASAEKSIPVSEGGTYSVSKAGVAKFTDSEGLIQMKTSQSFVRYEDDSVMSFADGVLLDLNDLSDNFINNYSIPQGMSISKNGSEYIAYTTNGNITFGDHIWKLSDDKYMIQSPVLKIHFADDDVREVKNFVQVYRSEEGIVYLLTDENIWTTISQDCYIETESGKQILPLISRVEDETYKISLAGLSVGADDNITLTSDQVRRQIVPEIKITTIDGVDGDNGTDGINGENGDDGEAGTNGTAGIAGVDGTDGENGAEGTSGSGGSSGSSGTDGKNVTTVGQDGDEGETGAYIEGKNGDTGSTGSNGADGTGGTEGDKGTDGTDGESGGKGTAGTQGNDGKSGTRGGDGNDGDDGTKGTAGAAGKKGVDASSLTSQNSQIPIMTIGDWFISSTTLQGSIELSDVSGLLHNLYKDATDSSEGIDPAALPNIYPGEVKVINAITGEEVICFPYKEEKQYQEFDDSSNFYKYFNGPDLAGEDKKYTVYFGIKDVTLEPDTKYTLEVSAYYAAAKLTDKEAGYAYRRTFITRNFYTDSSGVILTKNKAEQNRFLVDVSLDSALSKGNLKLEVYLLTPEQNEVFSLTKRSTTTSYVYKYAFLYNNDGTKITQLTGTPGTGEEAHGELYSNTEPLEPLNPYKLDFVNSNNPQSATYDPLGSDSEYIARVVVNSNGVEYLSSQELDILTLKKIPTAFVWTAKKTEEGGLEKKEVAIAQSAPSVYYNRVTGGFSVTRPVINDPDQSVVSYKYIPYVGVYNETTKVYTWEKMTGMEKTVGLDVTEPIEFYLPTGEDKKYKFSVELETFDNEKTIYYETDKSEEEYAYGSTLPMISYNGTTTFNSTSGIVNFSFGAGTNVEISKSKPLYLEVYAEGYYLNTIVYDGTEMCGIRSGHTGSCLDADGHCTCLGADGKGCKPGCSLCKCDWWLGKVETTANGLKYSFDLRDLYQNQKYTVTLRGYAKLTADSQAGADDYAYTELGTYSFRTNNVSQLTGNWGKLEGYDDPLATTLYLTSDDTSGYEISEIQRGRVILQLYEGQGTTGRVLGTREITTAAELQQVTYDDRDDPEHKQKLNAFQITADTFGKGTDIVAGQNYTIKVSSVVDVTYNLDTTEKGKLYSNSFTKIIEQTKIIASQATPPDLLKEPSGGVTAEPIYNAEAETYGGVVDENLSGDAIVGYKLSSTYDNVACLARQVRYYAFEYNDFYNALVNKIDPVGYYFTIDGKDMYEDPALDDPGIHKLMIMTREMTGEEATPPKVAVLFDSTTTDTDASARQFGEYMVYRVQPYSVSGSGEQNGMSRGLRYVFAYTVEYTTTGLQADMKIYPYNHSKYDTYMVDYGIGLVGAKQRFKGDNAVAYILNSGLKEAPKDEPEFNTYLYNAKPSLITGKDLSAGVATMYYTYRDPDKTIDTSGGKLVLTYQDLVQKGDGSYSRDTITVNAPTVTEDSWSSVDLNFITQMRSILKAQDIHSILPKVSRKLYTPDYSVMLTAFELNLDENSADMGAISADFDWDGYFAKVNGTRTEKVPQMVIDNHSSDFNYIDFAFVMNDTADTITPLMAERAYAIKVTAVGLDKDNKEIKAEKLLKVEGDGSTSAYARLSTGELSGFAAGSVKFSVQIIYDDGDAGWAYVQKDLQGLDGMIDNQQVGFGLYYTEKGTNSLSKYGYLFRKYDVATIPFGGLFEKVDSLPDFEKIVKDGVREKANYKYQIGGDKFDRYLYPFESGVDTKVDSKVGDPDGYILTPKGAYATQGYFGTETEKSSEVDIILPVINYQNYEALKQVIYLRAQGIEGGSLTLSGMNTAKAHTWKEFGTYKPEGKADEDSFYIVHVGVFEQTTLQEKYAKLDSSVQLPVSEADAKITRWQKDSLSHLIFNADGTLYGYCLMSDDGQTVVQNSLVQTTYSKETGWVNLPKIPNLNPQSLQTKSYYFSFFMDFNVAKTGETESIKQRIILGQDKLSSSDPKAYYKVTTSQGVRVLIPDSKGEYNLHNLSYFNKKVEFKFNLDPRSYGIKMRYEIYETEDEANTGMYAETNPAIPYIDLNSPNTASKLLTTAVVLTNQNNKVGINLTPSDIAYYNRTSGTASINNLQPGRTYYLRATAFDATATSYTSKTSQGYGIAEIQVAANSFFANIDLSARTSTSIDYRVTIGDAEHMAMGFRYNSEEPSKTLDTDPENPKYNDTGFYAVRFTDAKTGKLIKTGYDDYVYSFADLGQVFRLAGLEATDEGYEYTCNVYAVMDYDLDGKSGSVTGIAGNEQEWDYFFGEIYKPENETQYQSVHAYKANNFKTVIDQLWNPDGSENKSASADDIRNNYLVGSETKKTTPKEGNIHIPDGKYRFYSTEHGFVFEVTESYGVVTKNDQGKLVQGFDKIVWSIKEKATVPRKYTGTELKTNTNDKMFEAELDQSGELTGTFSFVMDMGEGNFVQDGVEYQLSIELIKNNDPSNSYSFSDTKK